MNKPRAAPQRATPRPVTQHAWTRMSGRGLNGQTIDTVLSYGRVIHVRGAAISRHRRKEVERLARSGVDVGGLRRCSSRLHPRRIRNPDGVQKQRFPRTEAAWRTALALMACTLVHRNQTGAAHGVGQVPGRHRQSAQRDVPRPEAAAERDRA